MQINNVFKTFLSFLGNKLYYVDNYFDHLKDKKISYIEHLVFSTNIAYMLGVGSLKAFAHSIYPDIYVTSSTELTEELSDKLKETKQD